MSRPIARPWAKKESSSQYASPHPPDDVHIECLRVSHKDTYKTHYMFMLILKIVVIAVVVVVGQQERNQRIASRFITKVSQEVGPAFPIFIDDNELERLSLMRSFLHLV